MRKIIHFLFVLGFLVLWSCGNAPKQKQTDANERSEQVEIITKTFSIKLEDGVPVKDTINMIQSMIVDGNGKEIANRFYNIDGSLSWEDVYQFNDNGWKVGSKFYEKNGKQTTYYEYDVDSLGRRLAYRAKNIETDTLLYDGASRYTNNGKIRKDGYINKKGKFIYNLEYQFDDDGKELGYTYIDLSTGDQFSTASKYIAFNEKGEWTERQLVEAENITGFEVRKFKQLLTKASAQ